MDEQSSPNSFSMLKFRPLNETRPSLEAIEMRGLSRHRRIDKNVRKAWKCNSCRRRFALIGSLHSHKSFHHSSMKVPAVCFFCPQPFLSWSKFHEHCRSMHPEMRSSFVCFLCGFRCKSTVELISHEYKHKQGQVMLETASLTIVDVPTKLRKQQFCHICQKTFLTKGYLLKHLQLHTGLKPYECVHCGKGFPLKRYLVTHLWMHNKNSGSSESAVDMSSAMPNFPCQVCGKLFPTMARLRRHSKTHVPDRPFSCEHCPLRFLDEKSMVIHRRVHTGERPYSCTLCEKTFIRKNHLNAHIKGHLQPQPPVQFRPRPHVCAICKKTYLKKGHLRDHERTHYREPGQKYRVKVREYKCVLCECVLPKKQLLVMHYKVQHNGQKPPSPDRTGMERTFVCNECGKAYLRRNHLVEHERMQHPPLEVVLNPFTCHHCGKSWVTKAQLTRHIKIHNKGQGSSLENNSPDSYNFAKSTKIEQNASLLSENWMNAIGSLNQPTSSIVGHASVNNSDWLLSLRNASHIASSSKLENAFPEANWIKEERASSEPAPDWFKRLGYGSDLENACSSASAGLLKLNKALSRSGDCDIKLESGFFGAKEMKVEEVVNVNEIVGHVDITNGNPPGEEQVYQLNTNKTQALIKREISNDGFEVRKKQKTVYKSQALDFSSIMQTGADDKEELPFQRKKCLFCNRHFDSSEACSEHEIIHLREEQNKIDGKLQNMNRKHCLSQYTTST